MHPGHQQPAPFEPVTPVLFSELLATPAPGAPQSYAACAPVSAPAVLTTAPHVAAPLASRLTAPPTPLTAPPTPLTAPPTPACPPPTPPTPPTAQTHPLLAGLIREARAQAVQKHKRLQAARPVRKPGDARKRRRPLSRREQSSLRSAEICREKFNIYPRLLERDVSAAEAELVRMRARAAELRASCARLARRAAACEAAASAAAATAAVPAAPAPVSVPVAKREECIVARAEPEEVGPADTFVPIVRLPENINDTEPWECAPAKRARFYDLADSAELLGMPAPPFVYGVERPDDALFGDACLSADTRGLLLGAGGADAPPKSERLTPTSVMETDGLLPDLAILPSSISVYGAE